MKTKLISEKIEKALIAQMTQEANAAQFYLALGSWADANGYEGVAKFLYTHMQEEREHMKKLVDYINQRGGYTKVQALKAPDADPKNLHTLFEWVLKQEMENSKKINAIVDTCLKDKDYATFSFLQWFVKEQIEEEALASKLLDSMKLIGQDKGNKGGLYELDRDIVKFHDEVDSAAGE